MAPLLLTCDYLPKSYITYRCYHRQSSAPIHFPHLSSSPWTQIEILRHMIYNIQTRFVIGQMGTLTQNLFWKIIFCSQLIKLIGISYSFWMKQIHPSCCICFTKRYFSANWFWSQHQPECAAWIDFAFAIEVVGNVTFVVFVATGEEPHRRDHNSGKHSRSFVSPAKTDCCHVKLLGQTVHLIHSPGLHEYNHIRKTWGCFSVPRLIHKTCRSRLSTRSIQHCCH